MSPVSRKTRNMKMGTKHWVIGWVCCIVVLSLWTSERLTAVLRSEQEVKTVLPLETRDEHMQPTTDDKKNIEYAAKNTIAVCGGTMAPIVGYHIHDATTCDEAYAMNATWIVEIFGKEVGVIDVKGHVEDGYCGHGWGVVKEGRVVCPRSPTTTPPMKQPIHGYEQIHQLLHSSDRNRCTKTHVLKGENAKEPDVHICLDAIPDSGCVVYSIGINNNWIFDDVMIEQGCQVFSFDPSMPGVKKHKRHANHLFEPIGIGTSDGTHTGESTLNSKQTNYEVETLGHIMERHGHTHLTMVRMDVESAEWDVLEQWIAKGWMERMDQLLLEIHMWKRGDDKRHSQILHSIPMELFHTATNHWDGQRLHGDMTRVHEMGWIRCIASRPIVRRKVVDTVASSLG